MLTAKWSGRVMLPSCEYFLLLLLGLGRGKKRRGRNRER